MSGINAQNFPEAVLMTNARMNQFDIRETQSAERVAQFPVLAAALRAEIRHFAVEFIPTEDSTAPPPVMFKLNFRDVLTVGQSRYISCLISMNETRAVDNTRGAGACVITVVPFMARSRLASAAFQFHVKRRWRLSELVSIIYGTHAPLAALQPQMRSGLASFHFVALTPPGKTIPAWRGCRDWISQVFVRLHNADMVAWVVGGIFGSETAPSPGSDPQFEGNNNYQRFVALPCPGYSLINWKTAGFEDIIGRNFSRPEIKRFLDDKRVEHVGEVVYHTAVDIWPGLFRPSVTRKYYANAVKAHELPYLRMPGWQPHPEPGEKSAATGRGVSGSSAQAPHASAGSGHQGSSSRRAGDRSIPGPMAKARGSDMKKG